MEHVDYVRPLCLSCGQDTSRQGIHEYYMLKHHIWKEVNPRRDGQMCIGCVEQRLGRKLTCQDFLPCLLNHWIDADKPGFEVSERLRDRIRGFNELELYSDESL